MKSRGSITTQFDTLITICAIIAMCNILVLCVLGGLHTVGYLGISLLLGVTLLSITGIPVLNDLAGKIRFCYQREMNMRARKMLKLSHQANILLFVLLFAVTFFLGGRIATGLFRNINLHYFMILICVALFLAGAECIFIGLMKGLHVIRPLRIGLLIQQVLMLVFSVLFERIFDSYAEGIAGILRTQEVIPAYRALGALCGMLIGLAIGTLMLLVFYLSVAGEFPGKDHSVIRNRSNEDRFIPMAISFVQAQSWASLQRFLLPFVVLLDLVLWTRISSSTSSISNQLYLEGTLLGIGFPFGILFLQLCKLLHLSTEPHQRASLRDKDVHLFREIAMGNMFHLLIVALPMAILMVVAAEHLPNALAGANIGDTLINVLRLTGVWMMAAAVYETSQLQLRLVAGKVGSAIFTLMAAVIQTIVVLIGLEAAGSGEVMLMCALLIFTIILAVLHLIYCHSKCRLPYPDFRSYAICAAAMLGIGLILYLVNQYLFAGIAPLIGLSLTVILFIVLYTIAMLFMPISEGNIPSSPVLDFFELLRERMRL